MTGGKLVPLENSHLEVIINENRDVLSLIPEVEYDLDQTKEFRYKHYPIILLILKHALKELISTQPPQPEKGIYILRMLLSSSSNQSMINLTRVSRIKKSRILVLV